MSENSSVLDLVDAEKKRQEENLTLIASENYVSKDVLSAQGSVLTNKYAEGTVENRYYAGCKVVDQIERVAKERARKLWGADYVNVQPHSGTQANFAVYTALLDPGDTILSLKLDHGGHLSHGSDVNASGQLFDVTHYGVDTDNGYIDYDVLEKKAKESNPDMIISGFSAYPRFVDWERISGIAEKVNAYHLADIAHITGLIAADRHPSPVGVADVVTGSTHKTIRAGRGGMIMTSDELKEDIRRAVFPGTQGGPLMHNIAGKAVGFGEALDDSFNHYIDLILRDIQAFADVFKDNGYHLVSGGTDNHLILVDLKKSGLEISGGDAEDMLEDVGIVLNANTVPGETRSPFNPSGIRIGTPAVATRGIPPVVCREIAEQIIELLENPENEEKKENTKEIISDITKEYRIYE